MKFYLASAFGTNDKMLEVRKVLWDMGHEITSRWIELPADQGVSKLDMVTNPDGAEAMAQMDASDLYDADCVAIFTEYGESTTGGYHVELGMALAERKTIYVVGPIQNIFQCLPEINHYENWIALSSFLWWKRAVVNR